MEGLVDGLVEGLWTVKMLKDKADRGRPVPMGVSLAESGPLEGLGAVQDGWPEDFGDVLGAVGKGSGCFNCGEDHFLRECPYKGKGKGKGGVQGDWIGGKADWWKGGGKGDMKG